MRNLLNQFIYYVSFDKEEDFVSEASTVKTKYEEELARIEMILLMEKLRRFSEKKSYPSMDLSLKKI